MNEIDVTWEEVKSKFGTEEMTLSEFAAFVAHEKGLPGLTDKTIGNYLEKICELSKNNLNLEDFKDSNNDGKLKGKSIYKLKPEWHGILAVMMCSDFFEGRQDKTKLVNIKEKIKKFYDNFEKYLNQEDFTICKEYSPYFNEKIEAGLQERIEEQLRKALIDLYMIDNVDRYYYMQEFLDELCSFRKTIHRNCRLLGTEYKYNIDNFLINFLTMKVHGEDYKSLFCPESLTPIGVKLMKETYHLSWKDDKEFFEQVDMSINNSEYLNKVKEKAKNILDLSKPQERKIYNLVVRESEKVFLTDCLSQSELEKIPYYVEEITKEYREKIFREAQEEISTMKEDVKEMQEFLNAYKEQNGSKSLAEFFREWYSQIRREIY